MTLTTHIIVAGAVAAPLLSNPPLAFAAGLASHYLMDAIPHWDWKLASIPEDGPHTKEVGMSYKKIVRDLRLVTLDISIGLLALFIVVAISGGSGLLVVLFGLIAAAFGGILPDALQFVYFLWQKQPMTTIQKLHDFFHAKTKVPHKQMIRGLAYQAIIIAPSLLVLVFFLVIGENIW